MRAFATAEYTARFPAYANAPRARHPRAGKTIIFRRLLPNADYALLEDPDILDRVRADPRAFLDDLPSPAIIDEI